MTSKTWIAAGMILGTCAWATWLFGSVDWAGAQKEYVSVDYSPDTAVLSMSTAAESAEKSTRAYLQDAEQLNSNSTERQAAETRRGSRNLFSARRSAAKDDGLEIIYIDGPKIEATPKPAFPIERYKLTGVLHGANQPAAFIQDLTENKSLTVRPGDKLAGGAVQSISPDGLTLTGDFGQVTLRQRGR